MNNRPRGKLFMAGENFSVGLPVAPSSLRNCLEWLYPLYLMPATTKPLTSIFIANKQKKPINLFLTIKFLLKSKRMRLPKLQYGCCIVAIPHISACLIQWPLLAGCEQWWSFGALFHAKTDDGSFPPRI